MHYPSSENYTFSAIIEEAASFVTKLFASPLFANLFFHNYEHTQTVVLAARELIREMSLSDSETEIVLLACWFHDTGYCTQYTGHEEVSKGIAQAFLLNQGWGEEKAKRVLACIAATRYPQTPKNLLEEIICDSDLYHLSSTDYETAQSELRQESLIYLLKSYSDQDWNQQNLDFLIKHRYFTDYARKYWEPGKVKNIQAQLSKLDH
ncbi:hypothetical protein AHMF7605_24475 [Adhaeribacter arboris]|uniref:HD domain-containing protein n=1 Tax=Adhaeribacter arboris TaxID=2072846 RepID=A0A2T2YLP1_9BACT|nr:HD domain-containing protein [Adhaeribacter arboris]PSR56428.1 hypothetical protein AHMF7605_24475 [Adhaeribacter arboris]